jgi:hypothetical protein
MAWVLSLLLLLPLMCGADPYLDLRPYLFWCSTALYGTRLHTLRRHNEIKYLRVRVFPIPRVVRF